MSKTIEIPEDLSTLDEGDLKYLHDRGRITDDQLAEALGTTRQEVQEVLSQLSQPRPLDELPNTGDANTAGHTIESHAAMVERMAEEQGSEGDDEDDDPVAEEPYETVKNDLLRGEIARRNEGRADEDKLSLDGNKDELIATLREDDNSEE